MEVIGADEQLDLGEKEFNYVGDYCLNGPEKFINKLILWKSPKDIGKPGYLWGNEYYITYMVDGKDFPSQKEAYEHIQKVIQDVLDGNVDLKLVKKETLQDIRTKIDKEHRGDCLSQPINMELSYFESVVLYNFIQNKVIELSKLEYPEVYKDW